MNAPAHPLSATRRALIVGATMAGGALLVGCTVADVLSLGDPKRDFGPFGPFIRIEPDGSVTVVSKHVEVGQGTHAGLAAIAAEELDADWDKVKVVFAPADARVYANTKLGVQGTGGSSAIANSWDQLRLVGAAARAMFVAAAASQFAAPAAEITVKDGVVSHAASGKSATFAELLPAAAKVTPPTAPALKDPKDFTLIGTARVKRKDTVLKSTGQARYTQDVRAPDMLTAMVLHSPRFGGKLQSFDASEAKKAPGVVDVFAIPDGVAVVANGTWAARQARDLVTADWDFSRAETVSTDALAAHYRAIAAAGDVRGVKWRSWAARGAPTAPAAADLVATFDFPYLAHAPMEPMNCVAEIGGGRNKLTFGSQAPTVDQMNTAMLVGALPGSIEIETLYAGGSFGRRTNFKSDYVTQCVEIARRVGGGRPVKLVWTREDDMTGGYFRPLTHHRVVARLGDDGLPSVWTHRVVTQSIMKGSPMPVGFDDSTVEGAQGSPYLLGLPSVDGKVAMIDVGVPVLWWRSVGATHTAFVMEHMVDQLAKKAGRDPADYRRALYARAGAAGARHRAVLDLALQKAGWGAPTAGFTQGLAVHESFGSVVAQIAEVKLEDGRPRVGRVVTAIDCGRAIAPGLIAQQMEGGTCLGLAAALYGKIDLQDGVVQQKNFNGYKVLRMNEAPHVETYILPSEAPPSGVGEPGTPVIAPAVANALLTLTGKPTVAQPFVTA